MIDQNHSRNLAVRPRAGCFHEVFLLPVLIAGLGLIMPIGRVTAQTFTTLHSFTGGSDGGYPSELTSSGSTLYGATHYGGSSWGGTVFKVNTDGTGFSTLYSFTATNTNSLGTYTNRDGFFPNGLILSSNTLYGTAESGGSGGNGTVFKLNTDGTGFTTLYSFTGGSDGAFPNGGLNLTNNTLYGTTDGGGSSGNGTAFAVNTDGTGFTNLPNHTGSGGLILSGNTLYGTRSGTQNAGIDCAYYYGSVFRVNTDGTGSTNLYDVGGVTVCNDRGEVDFSQLILSGTTLYVAVTLSPEGSGHGSFCARSSASQIIR